MSDAAMWAIGIGLALAGMVGAVFWKVGEIGKGIGEALTTMKVNSRDVHQIQGRVGRLEERTAKNDKEIALLQARAGRG